MPAAIDLHSHVLPDLDDGPADLAGALALARAAVAAGTQVLAATPHVGTHHPVVPRDVKPRVAALEQALRAQGIPLELVVGGELAPAWVPEATGPELEAVALGGGSCLLVECPFTASGGLLPAVIEHVHREGFRVLLAHPERSPDMLRNPDWLPRFVNAGVGVQITAASLPGGFGSSAQRYALEALDEGLVQVVASDAHDAVRRPPELAAIVADAVRQRRLPRELVRYVTEAAPRALLDDAPLPPAPQRARRRRAWWR